MGGIIFSFLYLASGCAWCTRSESPRLRREGCRATGLAARTPPPSGSAPFAARSYLRTPTHFELLIHDSDTKFSRALDEVFRSDGIEVIRTPIRAPNANAFAGRWVRTVRSDCLDRTITLRRRHLERVLRAYTKHYKEHRPHRALQLAPPNGGNSVAVNHTSETPLSVDRISRRIDPRIPTA
jgi:hypothetical protein